MPTQEFRHFGPSLAAARSSLRLVPATEPGPNPEDCPVCRGAGWVRRPDVVGGIRLCAAPGCPVRTAIQQARADAVLGASNIPPLFADAVLAGVRQPQPLREAVESAMARGQSLLFRGGTGTGKTYYAVALLRAEMARGRTGCFAVVPEVLDRVRAAYGEPDNDADGMLRALEGVDLLVLDDLGAERPTDWVLERLYLLVNARMLALRQTIYTTNLSPDDLIRRFGTRLMSRIAGSVQTVCFAGPDRRLLAARERGPCQ